MRPAATPILYAGTAIEFAVNAWTLSFVFRRSREDADALAYTLLALQATMLALLVAFALALSRGRHRAASWIASAFFSVGLVCSAAMRVWIEGEREQEREQERERERETNLEMVAIDAVNWIAIAAIAVKVVGFLVSLALALTI